ncbi:MAG: hypothetical protein HC824_14960 [Synechococcales cyanobacterium RM1_1_8]|nr:hypothetical protein [Synechococcales cyanobacterium RM1_1_8]
MQLLSKVKGIAETIPKTTPKDCSNLAMTPSTPDSASRLAVARSRDRASDKALQGSTAVPWEVEGEFELDAHIVNQSAGEILVKVPKGEGYTYLTIAGFLPGKIVNQRWHLSCIRESGRIELLDGEPHSARNKTPQKLSIVRIEDKKA